MWMEATTVLDGDSAWIAAVILVVEKFVDEPGGV